MNLEPEAWNRIQDAPGRGPRNGLDSGISNVWDTNKFMLFRENQSSQCVIQSNIVKN